ncbi:MAG: glycoside hydrolase family 5 protein [Oligoflexus sp.]
MKLISIIFFVFQLFLHSYSAYANSPAELADFSKHGRLSVEAQHIVSENGQPVILRGGALMDLLQYTYTGQMIDYLHDSKANVIRIPLNWGRGGINGSYEAHMQRFYRFVDYSLSKGLYVIADFHAVSDPEQFGLQEMARRFFQDVAKRYGSSGQLIYEIFNEPTGKSAYSNEISWKSIKEYSETMIDVIRAIDPDAFIIVPTPIWSSAINVPLLDPIKRSNIAYAYHFYASLHLFQNRNYEIATQIPIIVTEWAAQTPENSDGSINFKSLQQYIDWMNDADISWMAWSYSDEQQPYGWFFPGAMADGRFEDKELRRWGRMVRDLLDDGLLNQSFSW